MKKSPEFEEEIDLISLTTILPDPYLTEIGRVVANFAILERRTLDLIHSLLGTTDDVTRIVTSELSFRNLLDLSASLIKQVHGPNDAERYKAVLKLVGNAEEERNRIVHSLWKAGFEPGITRTKYTAKRARGLQVQNEVFMLEDLQEVAREVTRAVRAIKLFKESLGYVQDLSES